MRKSRNSKNCICHVSGIMSFSNGRLGWEVGMGGRDGRLEWEVGTDFQDLNRFR